MCSRYNAVSRVEEAGRRAENVANADAVKWGRGRRLGSADRVGNVENTAAARGAGGAGSADGAECAGGMKDTAVVVVGGFLIRVIP